MGEAFECIKYMKRYANGMCTSLPIFQDMKAFIVMLLETETGLGALGSEVYKRAGLKNDQ